MERGGKIGKKGEEKGQGGAGGGGGGGGEGSIFPISSDPNEVLVVLVSGRFLGLAYSMYNQSEQIISLLFLFS